MVSWLKTGMGRLCIGESGGSLRCAGYWNIMRKQAEIKREKRLQVQKKSSCRKVEKNVDEYIINCNMENFYLDVDTLVSNHQIMWRE